MDFFRHLAQDRPSTRRVHIVHPIDLVLKQFEASALIDRDVNQRRLDDVRLGARYIDVNEAADEPHEVMIEGVEICVCRIVDGADDRSEREEVLNAAHRVDQYEARV